MKKSACLLLLAVIIAGCAAQSKTWEAKDVPPLPKVAPALQVDIWLDCETNKLGAYTIELNYDPRIIIVADITTAGDGGFPGAPMANPATYQTGKTVIIGMYTGKDIANKKVKIARVRFSPLLSGTSQLAVSIQNAYDTEGHALPASAILSQDRIIIP